MNRCIRLYRNEACQIIKNLSDEKSQKDCFKHSVYFAVNIKIF